MCEKIRKEIILMLLTLAFFVCCIVPSAVFAAAPEQKLTTVRGTLTLNGFTQERLNDLSVDVEMINLVGITMYDPNCVYDNLSEDPFQYEFQVPKGVYLLQVVIHEENEGFYSLTDIKFFAKGENDEETFDTTLYPVRGTITAQEGVVLAEEQFDVLNKPAMRDDIDYADAFEVYCGEFKPVYTDTEHVYEYLWFAQRPYTYYASYYSYGDEILLEESYFPVVVSEEFDETIKTNVDIHAKTLTYTAAFNDDIESITVISPDVEDGAYVIDDDEVYFYGYPPEQPITFTAVPTSSHLLETQFVTNPGTTWKWFDFDEKPFDCTLSGTVQIEGLQASDVQCRVVFRDANSKYRQFYAMMDSSTSSPLIASTFRKQRTISF